MDEPNDAASAWGLIDLKVLLPGLLWGVFVAVFAGVGAAAKTRSLLLTLALPAAVVATLAVWMTWTLAAKRAAQRSQEPPGRTARDACQWADFERAFWSYVESSPDGPARAAE
jgi:hypothetical protein